MAKSSLERTIEKLQKEATRNVKKQIEAEKKLADKKKRETERQARIDLRTDRAYSIVNGQPIVGGMRFLDKTSEELVKLLCESCKENSFCISSNQVQLPEYLEVDLQLEFEKLKQYGLISRYAYYISGCWEINYLPALLTYEKDKEMALMKEQQENNSFVNNFHGSVSNLNLQQGTVNSTQTQNINSGFDFDAVSNIISQIRKYDGMLESDFGDKATELREKLNEIEELVNKQANPGLIKTLLGDIKNLAIGVGGSLIATGIVGLIP